MLRIHGFRVVTLHGGIAWRDVFAQFWATLFVSTRSSFIGRALGGAGQEKVLVRFLSRYPIVSSTQGVGLRG